MSSVQVAIVCVLSVGALGISFFIGSVWGYSHGERNCDRRWQKNTVHVGVAKWNVNDDGTTYWTWHSIALGRCEDLRPENESRT